MHLQGWVVCALVKRRKHGNARNFDKQSYTPRHNIKHGGGQQFAVRHNHGGRPSDLTEEDHPKWNCPN